MDDGKYTPWIVASAAFLCCFIVCGLMKGFGVLLNTVTEQCDILVWQYGNTVALMQIVGSLVSVVASPLMKIVYPRYLLSVAGFMFGSGFILAAIAESWIAISLALILLAGIGMRLALVFSMSVLPKYFNKHYLLACGLVYTGEPIGAIVFAPLSQFFLDTFGWRSTFVLLGACAYNSILCGVMIKPRINQISENNTKGNDAEKAERRSFLEALSIWFDLVLFKNFKFWSLIVGDLCVSLAWQSWIIYLIPHGEEKDLSPYQSSGLAIAGGVGFIIGLMLPSIVVDTGYVTDYQARTAAFIISGTTFLTDPWINSLSGQMILSFVCTTSMGVCYTLSMGLAMKVSVGNIAQVVSFSLFSSALGRYIGSLLTGLLFDVTGSYNTSFLVIGGTQIIAALLAGLAMTTQYKQYQLLQQDRKRSER